MTTTTHHERMHPTVVAFLRHLADIGRAPSTITTYRIALTRAGNELPSGLLALPEEIEAWLGTLNTASTRAVYGAALRSFYRWCLRRRWISENPTVDLEPVHRPRRLPRPCTLGEVRQLLGQASEPARLCILIAAYAGARCVEVARLQRDHVTEESTRLHGKGDKERLVPTHAGLWAAVRDRPPGPLVQQNAHAISELVAVECDRVGMPEVTMHRLRHTAGTIWMQATGDLRVVQELLGHASVATTQVYTAVANEAMRRAVCAMPDLTASGAASTGDGPDPGAGRP